MALPPAFGAVNTATVEVHVPPEDVWPVLFNRARWLDGFVGKESIDGPLDAVGERALFTSRAPDGAPASRIEEILLSERPRRLVTRLALRENDATFAFAEWRLTEQGGGSLLEMSLYWIDLPEAHADWPAIRAQREGYIAHTQATIERLVANIATAASARPAAR